jgi:hypothetical protein
LGVAFFFGTDFFFGANFFGAVTFFLDAFFGFAAAYSIFFPSALILYKLFVFTRMPSATPFFYAAKNCAFIHFLSAGMLACIRIWSVGVNEMIKGEGYVVALPWMPNESLLSLACVS